MGANFGVVYLRGARRGKVRSLLNEWAVETGGRCLLAPKLRGWLAVYPHEYGVDPALSQRLSVSLGCTVLHVYVHDDDMLGYALYRNGAAVDEYCSDPGYADDATPEEIERLRGRPELLADLLAKGRTVEELDTLLHPADGIMGLASLVLKEVADVLNLPNACTSYEYLMEEGTLERIIHWTTIRGWWRFKHIPSLRAQKRARRQRLARRAKDWDKLKQQGTLLAYQPGRLGWILTSEPNICPSAAGDGFYVSWSLESDGQLWELSPPWDGTRPALVAGGQRYETIATSPSGRWLVMGHTHEGSQIELWDMTQPARVAELGGEQTTAFDFAADDSKLLAIGPRELSVFELPGGRLLKKSKVGGDVIRGVFDPSGQFAVLVSSGELTLYDWQRGKRLRRWKLGQRAQPAIQHPFEQEGLQEAVQEQLAALKPIDFEAHFRKMATQLKLPADQIDSMLVVVRQQHQGLMSRIASTDWMDEIAAAQIHEMPIKIAFSGDGQWLLCTTDQGARVYRWAEFPGVLSALDSAADADDAGSAETPHLEPSARRKRNKLAAQSAPQPVYAMDGDSYQEVGEEEHHDELNAGCYQYALAYDPERNLMLYAGMTGTIDALDLSSGQHRTLAELPTRPTVMQLALSRDGQALCCTTLPQFHRDHKKLAPEVCVWNYPALVETPPHGSQ